MKYWIILIILSFLSRVTISQPDYREGYIILKNGQRLDGYINYKQFGPAGFYSCDFKPEKGSKKTSYTPGEIEEYGINSIISFHAYSIKIETNETNCFLKLLTDGKASLFEFRNRYFIQTDNSKLEELIMIIKQDTVKRIFNGAFYSTIYERKERKYLQTLTGLLSDCPEIQEDILKIPFDRKSLVKAVEKYNKCKSSIQPSTVNNLKWTSISILPFLEIESTRLDFKGEDVSNHSLIRTNLEPQEIPKFGVRVLLSSPRVNDRFAIIRGISFGNSHFTGIDRLTDNNNGASSTTHDIKFLTFHFPFYVRYSFPKAFFQPYFSAGPDFQFLDNQEYLKTTYNFTGNILKEYQDPIHISNHIMSLGADLGVNIFLFKKYCVFLEGKSEFGGQLCRDYVLDQGLLNSKVLRFSLAFGIGF